MNRMFFEWFSPLLLALVTSLTFFFVIQDGSAEGSESLQKAQHGLYPSLTVTQEKRAATEERRQFLALRAKLTSQMDRVPVSQAQARRPSQSSHSNSAVTGR